MAYLSYVIPIVTFVLGAALTLFLKRHDRRAGTIATYARELSDSATEWYNQIYDLRIAQNTPNPTAFANKEAYYIRNRLVLPKYLRALQALKKYPEAAPIVAVGEKILAVLTTMQQTDEAALRCTCLAMSSAKIWARFAEDTDRSLLVGSATRPDSNVPIELPPRSRRATFDILQGRSLPVGPAMPSDANLSTGPPIRREPPNFDHLVEVLDSHVQAINIEAGRIL